MPLASRKKLIKKKKNTLSNFPVEKKNRRHHLTSSVTLSFANDFFFFFSISNQLRKSINRTRFSFGHLSDFFGRIHREKFTVGASYCVATGLFEKP